jgi:hypothetical protein
MDEERQQLEKVRAHYPEPIARFLIDSNERHTRELTKELQALEVRIESGRN